MIFKGISRATMSTRCRPGQRWWWLYHLESKGFVVLDDDVVKSGKCHVREGNVKVYRGDAPIVIDEKELEPGNYVIGVGPRSRFGVRKQFKI